MQQKKILAWHYLPFSLLFLGFMFLNVLFSFMNNVDTAKIMDDMEKQLGKPLLFIITVLPLSVMFFVILFWVKFFHKQSITSFITNRVKIDYRRIFYSFGLWSMFLILGTLVSYLVSPDSYTITFDIYKFLPFALICLLLVPFQASFEELFFRGYLMQGLQIATKTQWVPLVISSLLFGILHGANPEVSTYGIQVMIFYIATGFLLGILTQKDKGLELALGFHTANNLLSCFLVTSKGAALRTETILTEVVSNQDYTIYAIYFQALIIYPLFYYLLKKKYNF